MCTRRLTLLLTFSQALYLARALPVPQHFGAPSEYHGGSGSPQSYRNAEVTVVDPDMNSHTFVYTGFPETQVPPTSDASQGFPDTTGLVVTTLETGGNPPIQPFPTIIPSITSPTLQPLTSTPSANTSYVNTAAETFTVPTATSVSVVVSSAVTSVPISTTVVFSSQIYVNFTYTANGSTITSNYASYTLVTASGAALTETTLQVATPSTATLATTFTTTGVPTISPTTVPTCAAGVDCSAQDIFLPVALDQPPANIQAQSGHPVPLLGIGDTGPIETNKFYANFFLGSQGSSVFTTPYSLSWSKGSGNAMSWGMAISHIDADQRVFGPPNDEVPNDPPSYYINPIGIQSLILSAAELGSSTVLTSDSLLAFSANIHLSPTAGASSSITFPVVQGMGFVTGIYDNLQPAIQSSVFFDNVASVASPKQGVFKYRVVLGDQTTWLLYAVPSNGISPNFELASSTLLQGLPNFSGFIQIAKNPSNSSESLYDSACGAYPTSADVSGYASGTAASYSLQWNKGGQCAGDTSLLMFALPHHLQSFDANTQSLVTSLQMATRTKGNATAVTADVWVLQESLPTDMGFAPWRPAGNQSATALSASAIAAIQNISAIEASQNMSAQTNLDSMYFSGKGLSKFATICYVMNDLANQQDLALAALEQLKSAFAVFVDNQQQYPLIYDTDWKGIVSSSTYSTGDSGLDFGNSYYNDHHFHYGYFIHAAAVIGHLDPSWLAQNKDYVNALVRDVSNPSSQDQYFPVFRSFDWYQGHSWAKGLYESGDGKDEESSSEDSMFAYALKMWGNTIGDASMEARGNLMLAVLARSLHNYFLLDSTNVNQPAAFIANKVTGILFENKVDHATYFGLNPEYIQGIHMLPLQPFSTLTRREQFVEEEWSTYFADGASDPASNVVGGWKGILYANLAIINPTASWNFFSQPDFDSSWLDGGASRTWYLAFAAGLGGAPS